MNDVTIDVLQNEREDGPAPIPTGDNYVYWVPSDHRPGVRYRVDLVANNGAGHCQCTDFGTRRQVNLDAGMCTHLRDTTCKHLRRAVRHFNRRLFGSLAQQENNPPANARR